MCYQVFYSVQNYIIEASSVIQSFSFGNEKACDNFYKSLVKLIRFRSEFCDELARCTCHEARWEATIIRCSLDCEQIWMKGTSTSKTATNTLALVMPFIIERFL
ncbi:hypothetical protein DICVIV_04770 [Dictyocaulus viviparus]|uniref:Uncharacterized protein n=1 Tax=Dictyocaulus viviparus TaxID=29172 RepID=A0A0D8XXA6_DICVI|nr:hypothetical protein DICVIV_04770 [Dictyocaulus viviparus]